MKVKEAIESLGSVPVEEVTFANLYHQELVKRSEERWRSGQIPMVGFCTLLKEMNSWIVKVCVGVGIPEYRGKALMRIFNDQAYNAAKSVLDKDSKKDIKELEDEL